MGWSRLPGDADQFSGDEPLDALTSALEVVAETYVNRFGRPRGSYPIWRKSTQKDVARCTMEVREGMLFIDYQRLDLELTHADMEALIIATILKQYTGDHYASEVVQLSLAESGASERKVMPYPRT
jgi:hypothetical protein